MTSSHLDISTLYSDHYQKLKRSLSSLTNDQSLLEDVIQDSFIKLHLYIRGGKAVENPGAWLYRVGKNLMIDHFRGDTILKELEENMSVEKEDTHAHGPEDCLLGIIASLPYKYKKAVYLTDIKGVPQKESAKNLNLSFPTFKSHVQRGRKLVAQGYVDCCGYSLDANGHLQGESKDWKECKICSES